MSEVGLEDLNELSERLVAKMEELAKKQFDGIASIGTTLIETVVESGKVTDAHIIATAKATMDAVAGKQLEEIKRLREMIWFAGHSWRNNWAIEWGPICKIMEEVDAEKEKED